MSAHGYGDGTAATAMARPRTIRDFALSAQAEGEPGTFFNDVIDLGSVGMLGLKIG